MADQITRARRALERAEAKLAEAVEWGEVIEGDRDWERMADQCDELEAEYYELCETAGVEPLQ